MGPAEAMGTFLRVWRSEWAHLSRAQLAIAVSAHVNNGKAVTPRMVLHWEEGHPPSSTEELEGLLTVMQRHGLTRLEVGQFRTAVFAACLDRQYPELLDAENLAHRPDVEEIARGMWQHQGGSATSANLVGLVAGISELQQALAPALRPTHAGSPVRKQAVALAYLHAALVKLHGLSNRFTEVLRVTAMNAALLGAHFGAGGLGEHYYLSGLGQQFMGAERGIGRQPNSFARLTGMAEHAMECGDRELARHAVFSAMECLGEEPGASVDALQHQWKQLLGRPLELEIPADDNPWNRRHLFRACLHAGRLELAAEHLAALGCWREDTHVRGCVWHVSAGELALREGRHDEAGDLLRRGLEIAVAGGFVRAGQTAERQLARCETPAHSGAAPRSRARRT